MAGTHRRSGEYRGTRGREDGLLFLAGEEGGGRVVSPFTSTDPTSWKRDVELNPHQHIDVTAQPSLPLSVRLYTEWTKLYFFPRATVDTFDRSDHATDAGLRARRFFMRFFFLVRPAPRQGFVSLNESGMLPRCIFLVSM